MIVFEEELKKFHKSLEVEDTEDAIFKEDLTDMLDLFLNVAQEYDGTYTGEQ
ncbi:MAG: hypothetical protein IK115_10440 [Lachnospiraceae bacterium]|nr:hypothetical protein [Lachnospiraceae bacterium]